MPHKEMKVELYPGVDLRTAVLADVERLFQLDKSVTSREGFNRWAVSRWIYEVNNNHVWIIENDKGAAGLIYAVGFIHDKKEHSIDVIKLTAAPTGVPLTAKLLQVGGQLLKEWNVEVIKGRCPSGLLEFYKRLGFEVIGDMPHYYGVGVMGYSIERRL